MGTVGTSGAAVATSDPADVDATSNQADVDATSGPEGTVLTSVPVVTTGVAVPRGGPATGRLTALAARVPLPRPHAGPAGRSSS